MHCPAKQTHFRGENVSKYRSNILIIVSTCPPRPPSTIFKHLYRDKGVRYRIAEAGQEVGDGKHHEHPVPVQGDGDGDGDGDDPLHEESNHLLESFLFLLNFLLFAGRLLLL